MEKQKILIVDDNSNFIESLRTILASKNFMPENNELEILSATSEWGAIALLRDNPDIKVILLDYAVDSADSGTHILNFVRKDLKNTTVRIIYLSGEVSEEDQPHIVIRDLPNGFIDKNLTSSAAIRTTVAIEIDAYEKFAAINNEANIALKENKELKFNARKEIEYIMGNGKAISKVLDIVERYAKEEDRKILLIGETGVGKEEIAKYLHNSSERRNYKFVPVNCSTITENIADSVLFGVMANYPGFHNKEPLIGKFEEAEGGTIFLDEVHALDEKVQDKLLRVLQNKKFARLGEPAESRTANVRVICASNLIEESLDNFRVAFISRIANKKIHIPPLRERYEDMNYFIDRFISEENKKRGKFVFISDEARNLLLKHDWKLNVRGLMDTIADLVIMVDADKQLKKYIIQPKLVKDCFDEQFYPDKNLDLLNGDYTWKTAKRIAMKNAIERALKAFGNNEDAISNLEMARQTYYDWKKELQID